ncbi:MAG: hypothetical protein ACJ72Z_09045 [Pyrinomonadaceae bacterium]
MCIAVAGQAAAPTPQSAAVGSTAVGNKDTSLGKKTLTQTERIKRWIEFDAFSFGTRYRYVDLNSETTSVNQQQFQVVARAKFKFDHEGKYSVNAGLFTGNNILSGWNNTGIGTGDGAASIYLKHLYFNAKPAKWIEIQAGGFGVTNGENTEITGYDNDVYLMGEHVSIRRPKDLYFDEISVTNAFIGDITIPNVFRRFKRLGNSNYHQVMVRKTFNKRVGFSADYTFDSGTDTLRQAVNVKTPELHFLDRVLFENYQRLAPDTGYGFSLFGEKKFNGRFTLGGGFTHIDNVMLNADRFQRGNRFFITNTIKFTRELSLNTFLIQAVGPLPTPISPRTRLDIILTYNFLETLHRLKLN